MTRDRTDAKGPEPGLLRVDIPNQQPITLGEGLTRIGRSTKNDICLREGSVSRFHCLLIRAGNETRIYDSRSSNRTRVGTAEAAGQLLRNGETIFLGRCRLVFHQTRVESAAVGPPSVKRRRHTRKSTGGAFFPVAVIILLCGVGGGFVVFTEVFDGVVDKPSAGPAISDTDHSGELRRAVSDTPGRAQDAIDDLRRIIAAQAGKIAALREQFDATERTAGRSDGAAPGGPSDTQDERGHLTESIARLEADRRRLAREFREALLGTSVQVRRGAVDDEPSTLAPFGDAEDAGVSVETTPADRSPRSGVVLSVTKINALADTLTEVLDRFGEGGIGVVDLEPELTTLSTGIGARPAEAILGQSRHAAEIIAELDRNLAFLRKRNEKWIVKARRGAVARGVKEKNDETKKKKKSKAEYDQEAAAEEAQRGLELSLKKIEIQEGYRRHLATMQAAILDTLVRFRDRGATEFLAAQFALRSDTTERLAILPALEAAAARHAVPLLTPKLDDGGELAPAVHRTLVKLVGEDLGARREPWDIWWKASAAGRGVAADDQSASHSGK